MSPMLLMTQYGSDTIIKETVNGISFLSSLLLFIMGLFIAFIVIIFFIDKMQTKDSVRRNYPVLGRFRGIFTELETVPFGSTKVLSPGTPIFANGLFPKLDGEHSPKPPFIIGQDSPNPYAPKSLFNISAMSYGSLSKPAVRALSLGAGMAGCWLNTGEGGVSPYHLEGECDVIYQLGTGKFGARKDDMTLDVDRLRKVCENPHVKMIEIKLSQGAKPPSRPIAMSRRLIRQSCSI